MRMLPTPLIPRHGVATTLEGALISGSTVLKKVDGYARALPRLKAVRVCGNARMDWIIA